MLNFARSRTENKRKRLIEQARPRVRILEEEDLSEERSERRYDSPSETNKSKVKSFEQMPVAVSKSTSAPLLSRDHTYMSRKRPGFGFEEHLLHGR